MGVERTPSGSFAKNGKGGAASFNLFGFVF